MDPVVQIQRLGWQWRSDGMGMGLPPGVLLTVQVDGRQLRAFVPLEHVWVAFDKELQAVGCVGSAWVGAPFSVGGFFDFVKKAVSSITKPIKKLVPKAIQRAVSRVVSTAQHYASAAGRFVSHVPVLGTITRAASSLALLPARAASQLIQGRRLDHIALDQFKTAMGNVRTLAPYVQTVVSFVPGIGQGVSAGIGGALALAQGHPISQALIEAARGAIPGGPVAQGAFNIAQAVMQHKPIDQIALAALPVSQSAKQALVDGLHAARALANGQNVSQAVIDAALHQLPPSAQKAVQVGVALGHARNLQQAAGAATQGAMALAGEYARGSQAAQAIARGARAPQLFEAVRRAQAARGAISNLVQHAQYGHPQARNVINALALLRRPSNPGGYYPAFPRFA